MKRTLYILIGLVFAAGLVGVLIQQRSQLLEDRRQIDIHWAQVEEGLKRRADLVPALLAASRSYAGEIQPDELAKARAALLAARRRQDEISANARLAAGLRRLLADPALKSSPDFERLSDALAAAENRIAVDRRDYNDAVKKYNMDLQLFPTNIAAALFDFHRDDNYLKTEPRP
ncbi:MAG TPA: LemA family protein [Bryobacteraceae bacterium]|nr:LemA family protein [Bryobacteraceae bacterium]